MLVLLYHLPCNNSLHLLWYWSAASRVGLTRCCWWSSFPKLLHIRGRWGSKVVTFLLMMLIHLVELKT